MKLFAGHDLPPESAFDAALRARMHEGAKLLAAQKRLPDFFSEPVDLPVESESEIIEDTVWDCSFGGSSNLQQGRIAAASAIIKELASISMIDPVGPISYNLYLTASCTDQMLVSRGDSRFRESVQAGKRHLIKTCTTFELEKIYRYRLDGPKGERIKRYGQQCIWGVRPDRGDRRLLARAEFNPVSGYNQTTYHDEPKFEIVGESDERTQARSGIGEIAIQHDRDRVQTILSILQWEKIETV